MKNTVDTVVISKWATHKIATDVQNDQSLQIFKFDGLFHVAYQVISKVEFHQTLQLFQAV